MINPKKVTSAYTTPVGGPIVDFVESTFDKTSEVIQKISGAPTPVSPSEKVLDLRLSPELAQELSEHFKAIGYKLEDDTEIFSNERKYTALVSAKSKIALLNFPPEILTSNSHACLDAFAAALITFSGLPCRIVSVEKTDSSIVSVSNMRIMYKKFVDQILSAQGAYFINWDDIDDFLSGTLKVSFANVFELQPGSVITDDVDKKPKRIEDEDILSIIATLSEIATRHPAGVAPYFRHLVVRSDWPEKLKKRLVSAWSSDPESDARQLVDAARLPLTYPAGHEKQGQSYLGWMLWEMIDGKELGFETQKEWANIILTYNFISDDIVLSELKKITE